MAGRSVENMQAGKGVGPDGNVPARQAHVARWLRVLS